MNKVKLWIPNKLYQILVFEADKNVPFETGGVFMGYYAKNQDIVVTNLISAGENAVHKKNRFTPDQNYQLEEIASIYKEEDGTITYLGDWHTHPTSKAELSFLDKRTLTKIACTPESKNKIPIMIILGAYPEKWTLKAVKFVSGKLFLWPFIQCQYEELDIVFYD